MDYKRVKLGCYGANVSMSVVGNLPPLLFLTFRSLYGISYTFLGALVVVNFATQLIIDLIFSFFAHKFNISKTVKLMPLICCVGLAIYGVSPWLFPENVPLCLLIGTIIFSASAGLAEVLISPVVAAIPSEDPDREMSKVHSVYAWGTVAVILISTLFLLFVGADYWQFLCLFFIIVPLFSFLSFSGTKLPEMATPEKVSGALKFLKNKSLYIFVLAIFLGGSSECTMAQWSSVYLEQALGIDKIWGDIFGVALFALMLGLGRTLYAKYGKNIRKVLFLGSLGATICYLTAAVTDVPFVGLFACGLTGLCTSMLWPGSLVVAAEKFPTSGVFIYAMMAAGGDLGASVGPQLVGLITDVSMSNPYLSNIASQLGISSEQFGMKCGMIVGMLFPLAGIFVFLHLMKNHTDKQQL